MFNPFHFFSACFKRPEQIPNPNEKHISSPIIQSCSGKTNHNRPISKRVRPISNRRKLSINGNNNSFSVEINLRHVPFLNRKYSNTTVPPSVLIIEKNDKNSIDENQYKKNVAKRWKRQRDNAIKQGFFQGNENNLRTFYELTNNVPYLYSIEFQESETSHSGTLLKKEQQVYLSKEAFIPFFKEQYGIMPLRSPSEAYVILPKKDDELTIVKILEKKTQTNNGELFEPKIWSSLYVKKEYEMTLGERCRIEYAICLNRVLEFQYKNLNISKINVIQALLRENNVSLFFGEETDYLQQLNSWTQFQ